MGPQAASQDGEIEHQRSVGEHELVEVDDHVGLRADRPRQRLAAATLRIAILVATAAQCWWLVIEVDDYPNLSEPVGGCKGQGPNLVNSAFDDNRRRRD